MKKNTEHSSIPTTSTATGVGTSLDSGGSAAWDGQCPVRARWHELCGAGRCGRNGMVGPDGEVGHAGDIGAVAARWSRFGGGTRTRKK